MIAHAAGPLEHGGDLAAARRMFPHAPEPFIDLSTGINPYPYKVPTLPPALFERLPQSDELARLAAVAAKAYGAPAPACVVAAPGTQILLPLIAALKPPGRAAILGPTYAEHARTAALAGHRVIETQELRRVGDADLAIVVNPNNPDGRIVATADLLALAGELRSRVGILIVDEAFMEIDPANAGICSARVDPHSAHSRGSGKPDLFNKPGSSPSRGRGDRLSVSETSASLAGEVERGNIVVLRSFGKFFGLAGLRLGFAIAAPDIAARLRASLGPWAVSGPAIAIGETALADSAWIAAMQRKLAQLAQRLDALLISAGLDIVGGTSLFRLAQTPAAAAVYERLGRRGLLVRRFAEHPTWLRFGLPGDEAAWERFARALNANRRSEQRNR
ncbi:MAG: threonine-phosphate decarboxylase [Rhodoplanes sp.]